MQLQVQCLSTDEEFNDASMDHFRHSSHNRFGFRCNYHFADNTCYGGPDGGSCPSGRRRRRRRQIVPETKESQKKLNNVQKEFSLSLSGKCGRGWRPISSLEKCKQAAHILGLSFQLQRDTGCIATEKNTTIGKAICQSVSNRMREKTETARRVEVKRRKRASGPEIFTTRNFTCTDWAGGAYWVWQHQVPSTCTSE